MNVGTAIVGGASALCAVFSTASLAAAPVFVDWTAEVGLGTDSPYPVRPAFWDVDRDGTPDAVFARGQEAFRLVLGPGGPSLEPLALPHAVTSSWVAVTSFCAADLDKDGFQELLTIGTQVHVVRATESGKFVAAEVPLPSLPTSMTFDCAAGDLNADGITDLAVATAIGGFEVAERRGLPDVVLIGLGHDRFELQPLEPARDGFLSGLTLADVDGDRRPDAIESPTFSQYIHPARILLNRTPPGAAVPVFEVHPANWDRGVNGMGVAVDDLDEDGYVDLCNTAIGNNPVLFGRADGTFVDQTVSRGFLDDWGVAGARSHWAASFADVNADGKMDLIARQGQRGAFVGADDVLNLLALEGAELLHVQVQDGEFERAEVPQQVGPTFGRGLVLGDFDSDGLPDVLGGGEFGSSLLWHNETEAEWPVVVRFRPALSADPPTGAEVAATCGGTTQRRRIGHGGKMGAVMATEVFLGFPGCAGPAEVVVSWPSGAVSKHGVAQGERVLVAEEPRWLEPASESGKVVLRPMAAGAGDACVGTLAGSTSCCEGSEECVVALPKGAGKDTAVASLDDRGAIALGWTGSRYVLQTKPNLPVPGKEVTFHVMHVGNPSLWFPDQISVYAAGKFLDWSEVDGDNRVATASTIAPPDGTSLDVTLFPLQVPPAATWSRPMGYGVHPYWTRFDAYTMQRWDEDGLDIPFRIHITVDREMAPEMPFFGWSLVRDDGKKVPFEVINPGAQLRRYIVKAAWEDLEGATSVTFGDSPVGPTWQFPVRQIEPEELPALLHHCVGGVLRNDLAEGGDPSIFNFNCYTADGFVVAPDPASVTLEVDGGEVYWGPEVMPGGEMLLALIRTDWGTTDGEVRVLAADDGRLLDTRTFTRRKATCTRFDAAGSPLTASATVVGAGDSTPVVVEALPRNPFGDRLGGDGAPTFEVPSGAEVIEPLHMLPDGTWRVALDLGALPKGEHSMPFTCRDAAWGEVAFSVVDDLPDPPEETGGDGPDRTGGPESDAGIEPSGDDGEAPPAPGCGGCGATPGTSGSGPGGAAGGWVVLGVLVALSVRRRLSATRAS